MSEIYDLTILGAGPVGLYAAYYAGFRKLRTKVVDSLPEVGGQITALYPEKNIYDVAGFPSITGKELVENLRRQMMQYDTTLALGSPVRDLEKTSDGQWLIRTDTAEHLSRTVLISSGLGEMNPRKLPQHEAFAQYEGRGLAYVMDRPEQYRGKTVCIVGGGDSAVDWANHLAPLAKKVYVVHRRNEFRAHEDSVEQMLRHTKVKTPFQVKEILGEGRVEEIILSAGPEGPEEALMVDAVLAFLGFMTSPGAIAGWGLSMAKNEILITPKCETNLPGVYAAGDCAFYEGKVKLISVGFGEAATAVNHAAVYLDPKRRVFPGHSSNMSA